MNAIEQEVAERVRASVIEAMTRMWQERWRTANRLRTEGNREGAGMATTSAIAINIARERIRMMDVEELLAPVEEDAE